MLLSSDCDLKVYIMLFVWNNYVICLVGGKVEVGVNVYDKSFL